MTRLEANVKICGILQSFVAKYPEQRFMQLLHNLSIVEDVRYNEESEETLRKIRKDFTEVGSCENNSKELFVCQCSSCEHIIIVSYHDEDVFVELHLAPLPFWSRLKNGLKYIFGHRCKYGDFDEIILDPKDADRIQEIANRLRALR